MVMKFHINYCLFLHYVTTPSTAHIFLYVSSKYGMCCGQWIHNYVERICYRRKNFMACISHQILFQRINQEWKGRAIYCVWETERRTGVLVRKSEGKRTHGRPRRRWEDNVEHIYLRIEWKRRLDSSGSEQEGVKRTYVNALKNLHTYWLTPWSRVLLEKLTG